MKALAVPAYGPLERLAQIEAPLPVPGRLPARGGKVLVTGVSGGVGSMAVGIARKLHASVTAVGSGAGLEAARRLGASAVIDRTERPLPGDLREEFDVVFDAAAVREVAGALARMQRTGGRVAVRVADEF